MNVEKRQEIERKVVNHLVAVMLVAGWHCDTVDDGGDEYVRCAGICEVVETVFSVDEAQICFRKGDREHWVMIVLGNSGWDCISDYSYSEDDDFEKIMTEEVDPYCEKLEMEA